VPAGWTANSSNGSSSTNNYTYRRVAGASEPATYTWTFGASATVAAWEGAYIGVNTTTPLDGINQGGTNSTTHTSPASSNANANDMIGNAYSLNAIATFTTPTGVSPEAVVTAGSGPGASLAVFDGVQGSSGTVPAKTTTSSVSAQDANFQLGLASIASNTVTLGFATTTLGSISSPALRSISIPTSAATFATGERLVFELSVPNDTANCGVRLSYDEATVPSKLTVATIVPEGVLGLLLLAPALPFGARWWKRRRP